MASRTVGAVSSPTPAQENLQRGNARGRRSHDREKGRRPDQARSTILNGVLLQAGPDWVGAGELAVGAPVGAPALEETVSPHTAASGRVGFEREPSVHAWVVRPTAVVRATTARPPPMHLV